MFECNLYPINIILNDASVDTFVYEGFLSFKEKFKHLRKIFTRIIQQSYDLFRGIQLTWYYVF